MMETYAVGVKLEMTSNVAGILDSLIRDFESFDKLVKASGSGLGQLGRDLRSLGRAGSSVAGIDKMAASLQAAEKAAVGLTTALRGNAGYANETAKAMQAGARAMETAGRTQRATSGGGRGGGGTGIWTPEMNEAYANAKAENANRDQIYRTQRAFAEGQEADREQIARTQRVAAEAENARRDAIYRNQRLLADYEQADRTRVARAHEKTMDHGLAMAGMGAGIAGGFLLGGVRHMVTPAIDVARTTDVLAADTRLTPEQVVGALNRARETTQLAPGSTTGENMAAIVDLKNVFGDLSEATKLLPEFARMSTLFQTMDKKGGGSGDQAFAAAKAMEILGEMTKERVDDQGRTVREMDPESGMAHLKMMERVAVATNMRVAPSDYLGLAKQARVAGMNLSDEFTFQKLPALMQVMGGQRAGTALMSMAQVFEGGKLTDKSYDALSAIGLAAPAGQQLIRGANGKMKMSHTQTGIYDLDTMRHDPLEWMKGAQGRMDAAGIHGSEAQITALMKASQRSTIAGMFADLLKDMPQILKEQQNIVSTRPDMAEHMAAVDPAAKIKQFEAAMTNLATELGSAGMGDAMKVLDAATAGLNKLGEWAREYPMMGRVAFDAAAGLGAVGTALGTLSGAILLFGPALRMLGMVGGGARVAAAGAAATGGLGAITAGAGGLPGVAVAGALGVLAVGSNAYTPANNAAIDTLARQRMLSSPANMPTADGFGPDGRPVTMTGTLNIDGKKAGNFIAQGMSGPNTGMTGNDIRTGHHGAMAHP